MDDVLDDFVRIANRCDRAAKELENEPLKSIHSRLIDACESIGRAWSGSWIGYQASVYTEGLHPRRPGEQFDTDWGGTHAMSNRTSGEWCEYTYEAIRDEILARAEGADPNQLEKAAREASDVFEECKRELLPTLDAVIETHGDGTLMELREKARGLSSQLSRSDLVKSRMPRGVMTHDTLAIQQGIQAPHHVDFQAWVLEKVSCGRQVKELGMVARHAARYLSKRRKMEGKTVTKTEGPIFIGHGGSHVWRDLKNYLVDRLRLKCEEFDSEPAAGFSTKERLEEMLDRCCFAFLVMTAEDEHGDGKKYARQNVVHETGLFQGRYGFRRAIILLESGCEEFSNIKGVIEIRFPKGDLNAVKDDIRRVLEREGIIK